MVTTLGSYTDEKYDTTMYHVRTILFDLDSSGDVETGNVVIFSSRDALSKDGFGTYARQYLAKDFGDVEMTVSRYTTRFEAVDAFLYRPGHIPLELSVKLVKKEVASGSLGKLVLNTSISKNYNTNDICGASCYVSNFGYICVGDVPIDDCSKQYMLICTAIYCPPAPVDTGGGGSGSGGVGGGGSDDDGSDDDGSDPEGADQDNCSCSNREQCDLVDEYNISDQGNWTCSKFKRVDPKWVVGSKGYESKHNRFAYISPTLRGNFYELQDYFGMNFYITSAYRCPVGNSKVSESIYSQHKYGTAADLNPPAGESNRWTQVFKRDIAVRAVRVMGAGWSKYAYSDRNHVHVDWGPSRPLPWSD